MYIHILLECHAFSITSVRTFISAIKRSLVPIYYCTGTVRRQQILLPIGLLKIRVQYFLLGTEAKNPLGLNVPLLNDLERSTGAIDYFS